MGGLAPTLVILMPCNCTAIGTFIIEELHIKCQLQVTKSRGCVREEGRGGGGERQVEKVGE